jgi:hypothetical protein
LSTLDSKFSAHSRRKTNREIMSAGTAPTLSAGPQLAQGYFGAA